jgi:hypothetical protein
VVRSDDRAPRRPGAAVIAVLLYALLFALALWFLRAKFMRSPAPPPPAGASASARVDSGERAFLLGGAGLAPSGRERLLRRLASARCDCGCDLTLKTCLAQDRSCARSPEIARALAGIGP